MGVDLAVAANPDFGADFLSSARAQRAQVALFSQARAIAAIAWLAVAVITVFAERHLQDAVAAIRGRLARLTGADAVVAQLRLAAGAAAVVGLRIGVVAALLTLDQAVAAYGWGHRDRAHSRGRITGVTVLDLAIRRATVVVLRVAVIAGFMHSLHAVAADLVSGNDAVLTCDRAIEARIDRAYPGATIAGLGVAVIALFGLADHTVAADVRGRSRVTAFTAVGRSAATCAVRSPPGLQRK